MHGAVRVSSIYTGESGEWKLGGFDILSSMKEEDAVIYVCHSLSVDLNEGNANTWIIDVRQSHARFCSVFSARDPKGGLGGNQTPSLTGSGCI